MFKRPVGIILTTCIRHLHRRTAVTLRVPLRIPAGQLQRRCYATPPPQLNHSELSVERYHALSDATMDTLWESLEGLLDAEGNPNYEVEYNLGDHGTYVINKQPPNKQIWLSSPISGPKRYDYSEEKDGWLYTRDSVALSDLLNGEIGQIVGRQVELGLDNVSQHTN
ncbi:Frataxin [Thelephora terrestris]|uniref:ferroxidase n=1 Tax=Thelephora terrestris TaxID=56493 RepID=A0A9P6H2P7_9AGAM|nr:Frataxin [Thelephora terrestris]